MSSNLCDVSSIYRKLLWPFISYDKGHSIQSCTWIFHLVVWDFHWRLHAGWCCQFVWWSWLSACFPRKLPPMPPITEMWIRFQVRPVAESTLVLFCRGLWGWDIWEFVCDVLFQGYDTLAICCPQLCCFLHVCISVVNWLIHLFVWRSSWGSGGGVPVMTWGQGCTVFCVIYVLRFIVMILIYVVCGDVLCMGDCHLCIYIYNIYTYDMSLNTHHRNLIPPFEGFFEGPSPAQATI